MVLRGGEKTEESSGMISKTHANKFLNKPRCGNSQYTSTNSSAGGLEYAKISEQDIQVKYFTACVDLLCFLVFLVGSLTQYLPTLL